MGAKGSLSAAAVLRQALARQLLERAPGLTLRIIPSGVPSLEMLRDGVCDLAIGPCPPEGSDSVQKRLFENHYSVYWDPAVREGPRSLAECLVADRITVVCEPRRTLHLDRTLNARGLHRRFAVMVPGFACLRGSPLLATAPALQHGGFLRDFARAEVPTPCPSLPMQMI